MYVFIIDAHLSLSSEPLPPSGFNLGASDLDARDKTITLAWNAPSSGVTSGYDVEVLDGGAQKASYTNVSNTQQVVNFNNMRNGYTYTVKIKSRSQIFNENSIVSSDVFETPFKTVVQGTFPLYVCIMKIILA